MLLFPLQAEMEYLTPFPHGGSDLATRGAAICVFPALYRVTSDQGRGLCLFLVLTAVTFLRLAAALKE